MTIESFFEGIPYLFGVIFIAIICWLPIIKTNWLDSMGDSNVPLLLWLFVWNPFILLSAFWLMGII